MGEQRQTVITLDQIHIIAEALSRWQNTWLARNPDLTHMSDEEFFQARQLAFAEAQPALELLTELHSRCFHPKDES